jgi:hypothetical protein
MLYNPEGAASSPIGVAFAERYRGELIGLLHDLPDFSRDGGPEFFLGVSGDVKPVDAIGGDNGVRVEKGRTAELRDALVEFRQLLRFLEPAFEHLMRNANRQRQASRDKEVPRGRREVNSHQALT